MRPMIRPACILITAAAAMSLVAPLLAAALAQPPAHRTPAAADPLIAHLETNAALHHQALTRATALYESARIPESDVITARIAALEAEILLYTVQENREAVTQRLRQIVEQHEAHLQHLRNIQHAEPDDAHLAASQALAEAQVRLWQATRPTR
jgi:hypothetical protein